MVVKNKGVGNLGKLGRKKYVFHINSGNGNQAWFITFRNLQPSGGVDCTAVRVLALHMTYPGLISGTTYGSHKSPRSDH